MSENKKKRIVGYKGRNKRVRQNKEKKIKSVSDRWNG